MIPGEVGASAVQNIGAYGVEAKDLIVSVDTFGLETGEERRFMREECRYAYRESVFKQELKGKYAVTFVTYRLKKHPVFHLEYGNIISPQFPILLVLDVLYAHYLQIDRSKKEALHEYTIQTLQPFLIK